MLIDAVPAMYLCVKRCFVRCADPDKLRVTAPSEAMVDSSMPQQQQQQNGLLPAPERRGLRAMAAASAPSVVVSAQLPASIAAATTGAASAPRKCAFGRLTMYRQLRWNSKTFEMVFWADVLLRPCRAIRIAQSVAT